MQKGFILSVDDDEDLQIILREYFKGEGYQISQAFDAKSAKEKLGTGLFDLVLLDLTLPDGEGLDLLRDFKNNTDARIIVISGNAETTEKIICLELGADDYMTKPFELRELSARIKAILRRIEPVNNTVNTPQSTAEILKFGDGWALDRTQYQLFDKDSKPAGLTTGQFKLLEALVRASNRVLSREHLFELTRDGEFEAYDRAIDIQVARLRQKLNDNQKPSALIKTVRGVGYMFCGDVESA